jgi:hypothetical protein
MTAAVFRSSFTAQPKAPATPSTNGRFRLRAKKTIQDRELDFLR